MFDRPRKTLNFRRKGNPVWGFLKVANTYQNLVLYPDGENMKGFFFLGGEVLRVSTMISPLRVIKPKAMKKDKGWEGGHKIRKMGRRR